MLFRGTAGINLPVYDMFVIDGPLIQTSQAECQSIQTTSCNTHYRNPLLQQWDQLHIHQVSSVYTRKSLKILKGYSESVNRRRTDNTMAKRKSTKGQTYT